MSAINLPLSVFLFVIWFLTHTHARARTHTYTSKHPRCMRRFSYQTLQPPAGPQFPGFNVFIRNRHWVRGGCRLKPYSTSWWGLQYFLLQDNLKTPFVWTNRFLIGRDRKGSREWGKKAGYFSRSKIKHHLIVTVHFEIMSPEVKH